MEWQDVEGHLTVTFNPPDQGDSRWFDQNDNPVPDEVNAFLNATYPAANREKHDYEMELTFLSTGYFHPATWADPPEGEDERTVTKAEISCDYKNSISVPKELLGWFEEIFEKEIDEVELDYYEV